MEKIVDIDFKDNAFILKFNSEQELNFIKNYYLSDYSHEILSKKNMVYIKQESHENFIQSFLNIENFLLREKFNIKQSKILANNLSKRNKEIEEFKIYSKKAEEIKNDKHSSSDAQEFLSYLKKGVKVKLYPKQMLSAYHMSFCQNACNFSVPGAGKTITLLSYYGFLKSKNKVDKILVFGTPSSFLTWETEFKICFGKNPNHKRLIEIEDKDHLAFKNFDQEMILASYHSLLYHRESIQNFLKNHKVLVVLDEGHKIKSVDPDAKWSAAALEIAPYCEYRVALTGTPLPNGYEDLYNLYKFIWCYEDIIKYKIHTLKEMTERTKNNLPEDRVGELNKQINPFFMRITKRDLNLPEPKHFIIEVGMDSEHNRVYKYIEQKIKRLVDMDGFKDHLDKAKFIRLLQACTDPSLIRKPLEEFKKDYEDIQIMDIDIKETIENYENTYPQKFYETLRLIRDIQKNKGAEKRVIIWCLFRNTITRLEKFLNTHNIEFKSIHGGISNKPIDPESPPKEELEFRENIIREFNSENSSFQVLIASLGAISESVSLHKGCRNAIYLEKDLDAAKFIQSKDRIHRYGLKDTDKINYYYLVTKDTIDLGVLERLKEKERMMLQSIEKPTLLFINYDNNETPNDIKDIFDKYF